MKSIANSYQSFGDQPQNGLAEKAGIMKRPIMFPPLRAEKGKIKCLETKACYGIFLVTGFIGIKVIKSFISSNLALFTPGT